jgi:CRISPR/Cas system-associated protein Cas10 (large subunit of type III CRISPR-Cas system)
MEKHNVSDAMRCEKSTKKEVIKMARYRKKVSKRRSKKMFRRTAGSKSINRRPHAKRGGIRL